MKFRSLRIITNDMTALTRFYQDITGIAPVTHSRITSSLEHLPAI